jgi:glucose-1-phosphate adenylyltransferase
MSHPKVLSIVLAGGKGERLFPLTAMRSKPSVPFGGRFRIVDFVLSNLVNSHIFSIYLLVQYKSQSLIEHIRKNWVLSPVVTDHFIALVPPQMKMGTEWFQGTADAVFQNGNLISDHNPELVIVFGADHIYRMDIRQMMDFHLKNEAHVTVAARPVPIEEASAFGVLVTDEENRIIGFQEKPKKPKPMPDRPDMAYVSMGNYIFGRDVLLKSLSRAQRQKQHDFGAHILPDLVDRKKRVFAYDFATNVIPGVRSYEEVGYWRDVGTIQAYFNTHMDMLGAKPKFDPFNAKWPVHSGGYIGASAQIVKGDMQNTSIAEGAVIDGARIRNSVLRSGVKVGKGSVLENCIILDNVVIKDKCRLRNVIVDKSNVIESGEVIGHDMEADRFRCHIDPSEIRIIPKGGRKKHRRKRE